MTHYSLFPAGRPDWTSLTYFAGDDGLSDVECKAILDAGTTEDFTAGRIGGDVEDSALRSVQKRDLPFGGEVLPVQAKIVDAALRANDHWWGFDVTHLQKMEVCRYGVGDHFVGHTDWGPGHTTRKLSIAVLLNDPAEFDGGEWVFKSSEFDTVLPPEKGMIVVFPSFIVHKVNPVTRGERWSATAWMEGPPFR